MPNESFPKLKEFIAKIPGVKGTVGTGRHKNGCWWVKFRIDTEHRLAWRVVQELGFVLNYVSVTERLPTVFMPVSPPPYLNGGVMFLSWVIESRDIAFEPDNCVEWLEGRLPRPVDDEDKWNLD